MKNLLTGLSLAMSASMMFGQGTVQFVNTPTTLVSAGPVGQEAAIVGLPGSYYFGLLIAAPGTADLARFTFTGVYATNVASAGRLGAGSYTPTVPGWAVAVTMSFLVAGWSSSLGHDWNQQWVSGSFNTAGYFGLSGIGLGYAGGPGDGGGPLPPYSLFGGSAIQNGWNLDPVPEPSAAALLALAATVLMLCERQRNKAGVRMAEPSVSTQS
jgi:hypothetical protein